MNGGDPQGVPDYSHLKPLVLVGKVSLRGENRLTCFAKECGRVIVAPDLAWFFRRRTRGGLGVVIYCETCKSAAQFDPVFVIHYPERDTEQRPDPGAPFVQGPRLGAVGPPPAPVNPPAPSRFLRGPHNQQNRSRPPAPRPRVGIWRPEQDRYR